MIKIGSRVREKGDPTREGKVRQINHNANGTFANVLWDNGIKSYRLLVAGLELVPQEEHPSEVDQLKAMWNEFPRTGEYAKKYGK